MKKVIDISKFQDTIYWKEVTNIDGVVIRLGYRGYHKGNVVEDPKFLTHLTGCRSVNLPYSIYFFPCSVNTNEANEEADFIIKKIKEYNLNLSFPVFLDSEVAEAAGKGRSDKLSKELRTHLLKVICDRLEAEGIKAGVYASTSWLNNNLNMSILDKYTVWVAQYASKCTYKGVYSLWQYTSKGRVSGIKGNVDVSKVVGDLPCMVGNNENSTSDPVEDVKPYYIKGKVYRTGVNLHVRHTPNGIKKKPYDVTVNAKVNGYTDHYGNFVLNAGTRVTCLDVVHDGNSIWLLIPSGYICAVTSGGSVYIS